MSLIRNNEAIIWEILGHIFEMSPLSSRIALAKASERYKKYLQEYTNDGFSSRALLQFAVGHASNA